MNIQFTGNHPLISAVDAGTKLLLSEYQTLTKDTEELSLNLTLWDSPKLLIEKQGLSCSISCKEPAHYFRGLNYILHHLREDFTVEEASCFQKNGFMLDCSRNSVARPEKVKSFIRTLAKTGMNQLLLYTEDTYQVPGLSYFGAYRGRYSKEELRELDSYAALFGIELVPCIQTLAHLHNFLKWPEGKELKDTADVLKVDSEAVYDFIRLLLTTVKDCFTSRNIHIGMDEAVMLGLGNYLKENSYTDSAVLIRRHSARVLEICKELGFTPMMWSDMYITSNTGKSYYAVDENTSTEGWEKPDRELGLVYWDYYNYDRNVYKNMLRVHRELSDRTVFAGGVWNWNGISPNYSKAFQCTLSALKECRAQGIQEVFATAWMDNGADTPLDAVYPGLVLFAELGFHEDVDPDSQTFKQAFWDCTDSKLEDFCLLDRFDSLFKADGMNLTADNPSKYLLFQDPMLGIFDYHIKGLDTRAYYSSLAKELETCKESSPAFKDFFRFYECLALVLTEKADLGVRLKEAYDSGSLSTLEEISGTVIHNLIPVYEEMHRLRETLWMKESKPFGYELLDIKLAGVKTRLLSTQRRIEAYLGHETERLEELEEERLPYWASDKQGSHDGKAEMRENIWSKIVSGCDLIDTI